MEVRRGQIGRIGWVIKTLETKVGQFLLDRAVKIPKVAQTTGTVDVFDPRSVIS